MINEWIKSSWEAFQGLWWLLPQVKSERNDFVFRSNFLDSATNSLSKCKSQNVKLGQNEDVKMVYFWMFPQKITFINRTESQFNWLKTSKAIPLMKKNLFLHFIMMINIRHLWLQKILHLSFAGLWHLNRWYPKFLRVKLLR